MSWTRKSDNARSHPVMMRVKSLAVDDREPMEFLGFVSCCYEWSGEQTTDYVVSEGAMLGLCDSRDQAQRLMKLGLRAKWISKVKDPAGFVAYRMIDDPDFFHIFTKAEKEWKLQQRNDTRNTELTSQVRLRDGDQCRWCGKLVAFGNTRGHNGGKYGRTDLIGMAAVEPKKGSVDHLTRGPASLSTLVISCLSCNQSRGNPEAAESDWALRPVPTQPYYSLRTAEFLANNGYQVESSEQRPGDEPDHAHSSDPAERRLPRTVDPGLSGTPTSGDDLAADYPPGPQSVRTRSAGSGRVGSGRAEVGEVVGSAARRKRSARGRQRHQGGSSDG